MEELQQAAREIWYSHRPSARTEKHATRLGRWLVSHGYAMECGLQYSEIDGKHEVPIYCLTDAGRVFAFGAETPVPAQGGHSREPGREPDTDV
jgi:hypothetical protein